ncbi:hypothetical protein PoB_002233500, partial [Plakobranchus ocellatus]
NKNVTLRCSSVQYNCAAQTSQEMLVVAKRLMEAMCSDHGLLYFKRVYEEEKHCLGNATVLEIMNEEKADCMALGLHLVKSRPFNETCRYLF